MPQAVKWLPKPEKHDYQAAEDYPLHSGVKRFRGNARGR